MPALRTERALARLAPGTILEVLADDPLAPLDIAHLCATGGHMLLHTQPIGTGAFRFTIRRGDAPG